MLNNQPPAGYGTGGYAALNAPSRCSFYAWGVFRHGRAKGMSKNSRGPDGPQLGYCAGIFAHPGEWGCANIPQAQNDPCRLALR